MTRPTSPRAVWERRMTELQTAGTSGPDVRRRAPVDTRELRESAALTKTRQELRETYEQRGMSRDAAARAAAGRGMAPAAVEADACPFDELTALYEARGMSPEAAQLAAAGRGVTVSEARQSFGRDVA